MRLQPINFMLCSLSMVIRSVYGLCFNVSPPWAGLTEEVHTASLFGRQTRPSTFFGHNSTSMTALRTSFRLMSVWFSWRHISAFVIGSRKATKAKAKVLQFWNILQSLRTCVHIAMLRFKTIQLGNHHGTRQLPQQRHYSVQCHLAYHYYSNVLVLVSVTVFRTMQPVNRLHNFSKANMRIHIPDNVCKNR